MRTIKRYLTHDQIAVLARAVGAHSKGSEYGYDVLVLTLAYCGLRWGELSGLRVRDLDLARRHLTIQQTVVPDRSYQREEPPKDYEHRSIPIPGFLVDALCDQTIGRGGDDPVFYGSRTKIWLRSHTFRNGWFDPAASESGSMG